MNCWMFPGQPLRHEQLFPDTSQGAEIVSLCRTATGFDPSSWLDEGELYSPHVKLQIYGTAFSLSSVRLLRLAGQKPGLVLEHSMGIYAALSACGSISEKSALELTARIGRILTRMSESTRYALGCIIGLGCEAVKAAAVNNGVYVANYNTSSHFLLAGERSRIMAATEECSASGAFSLSVFECDAPLHTPLVSEFSADLKEVISEYHFAEPQVALLDHISQQPLTAEMIPSFLLEELLKPVWWQNSYEAARNMGASLFVEVGAGEALKKFNRWIDSENRA